MIDTAFPVTAVIPTRNRSEALGRTFASLVERGELPAQIVVVDGSDDESTRAVVERFTEELRGRVDLGWQRAQRLGAATQRNEGVAVARFPYVWFFDDDVYFEAKCLSRLLSALQADPKLGGVNAMITNQNYRPPGRWSRLMFALMNGDGAPSYAGRVLGPAVNLLPADDPALGEVVPVEWLNTTCTLYRRDAMPAPPFDPFFTGYSLMEDLALSLRVGQAWKLANVRTARIFHDSQPGSHKADVAALSAMELTNRHYVMTRILGRRRLRDYARLAVWESYHLALAAVGGRHFFSQLRGKIRALGGMVR